MRDFCNYVLDVLHYPHGELSFCNKVVVTAADVKELKKNDLAQMFPALYDKKIFGGTISPSEVLWEKLLMLWIFDASGFIWEDFGVYNETGDEVYILPHVIRNPMSGFSVPITWSGADCTPYTLLCLARYYDYGTVCIRFCRKWHLFVNQLYNEGHVKFADRKIEYNAFLSRVSRQVTDLVSTLVNEVTKLPSFKSYLAMSPTSIYHELVGSDEITSDQLDLLFDVLSEFFELACKE